MGLAPTVRFFLLPGDPNPFGLLGRGDKSLPQRASPTVSQVVGMQKHTKIRRKVTQWCRKSGNVYFGQYPSEGRLAEIAEGLLGLDKPNMSPRKRLYRCYEKITGDPVKKQRPQTQKVKKGRKRSKYAAFYRSLAWKEARYDALRASDGRCELCGVSAKDGAKLNVDHIKPLKTHWDFRCEPSNLQVLCGTCNHGKGNRDDTDWRESSLTVLMGERME